MKNNQYTNEKIIGIAEKLFFDFKYSLYYKISNSSNSVDALKNAKSEFYECYVSGYIEEDDSVLVLTKKYQQLLAKRLYTSLMEGVDINSILNDAKFYEFLFPEIEGEGIVKFIGGTNNSTIDHNNYTFTSSEVVQHFKRDFIKLLIWIIYKNKIKDYLHILTVGNILNQKFDLTKKTKIGNEQFQPDKVLNTPPPNLVTAQTFSDIFSNQDWQKYILVLKKTEPPLINSNFEFIGNPKRHKGVICSWIKHLQYKGIIKQTINRSKLADVLNNELKNFNMGKDGKSFDNTSETYKKEFEFQLLALIKKY